MMQSDEFIETVRVRLHLESGERAVKAIGTTLEMLGELLPEWDAAALASHLPAEIGKYLLTGRHSVGFGLHEFFRRISEREGSDIIDAEEHAQVVLAAIAETITPEEIEDILSELPNDFRILFRTVAEGRKGYAIR